MIKEVSGDSSDDVLLESDAFCFVRFETAYLGVLFL